MTSHGLTLALVHKFLHELQTFNNATINMTTGVVIETRVFQGKSFLLENYLVCKAWTTVLGPQDWDLFLYHTHIHIHGVALSNLDKFLWRSAFYSLFCHFDYHYCYNCTTTYTIYHYYSSLFSIIIEPIMVLKKSHLCSARVRYSFEY